MNISHFRQFLLLVFLALISSWIVKQFETETENNTQLPIANITIESLNAREYNTEGQLYHQLFAQKLEHFKDQGETTMSNPQIIFFEEKVSQWRLMAKNAKVSANREKITLLNDVEITHINHQSNAKSKLNTASLDIYYKKMLAETTRQVTLINEGQIITATGLQVNFQQPSKIRLLSNVKGIINAL